MACSKDHSQISGKFCPSCGEAINSAPATCSKGHLQKSATKFCYICGENMATRASTSFATTPPIPSSIQTTTPFQNQNQNQNQMYGQSFQSNSLGNDYTQSLYDSQSRKSKKGLIIGLSLGGVGVVIAGIVAFALGVGGVKPPQLTPVDVSLTLIGEDSCWDLSWGYSDVQGAQVVVSVDGVPMGFGSLPYLGDSTYLGCVFETRIRGISMEGDNYSVEVGRRGTIYKTKFEMIEADWAFELSLGS